MQELIKSIVLAVLGLVALCVGLITNAGLEVLVVSGLLLLCGVVWVILDIVKVKKNK